MSEPERRTLFPKLRQRRVLIPLTALLLAVGGAAFWLFRTFWVPAIDHPFDVRTFGTDSVDDADNAYVDYQAAVSKLKGGDIDVYDNRELVLSQGWSAASDELRNYLETSRPALEIWKAGTEKPDALYQSPRAMTINTLLQVTQELREFVRLATLEGARLEADGQVEVALGWYQAALRSSRHAGRRGCMIERLVGIALYKMTADGLAAWSANPTVDAELLRQAREDAVTVYALTEPLSTAFKVEYFMQRNTTAGASVQQLLSFLGITDPGESIKAFLIEPRYSDQVIRHVYANWLPYIDLPRWQRPPRRDHDPFLFDLPPNHSAGTLSADEIERYYATSVFARRVLPSFDNIELAVTREQSRQAALLVVLAAQEYFRIHGKFPESLAELHDMLDPPLDPFGNGTDQLIYRPTESGAVVYSRGDNGQDDGAKLDWSQPSVNPNRMDIGYEIRTPGTAATAHPDSN